MLLSLGLVFLAITVTVLLWDSNRLLVLGLLSTAFLSGGSIALFLALRDGRPRERLFSASVAELKKDRAAPCVVKSDVAMNARLLELL